MDNHNENSHFLKGSLMGAILGGAAGLLLAPKSGKELREDISKNYTYLNEKLYLVYKNLYLLQKKLHQR